MPSPKIVAGTTRSLTKTFLRMIERVRLLSPRANGRCERSSAISGRVIVAGVVARNCCRRSDSPIGQRGLDFLEGNAVAIELDACLAGRADLRFDNAGQAAQPVA